MANTFFGLTIASTGLSASNVAVNTTAHNISNINTEGYTKQYVNQTAASSIRVYSSYGTVGTGTQVTSIEQLRSSYYDTKYWNNNANQGEYSTLESYSTLIEDYLDEFNLDGFTVEYANLFNAINTLTTDPTSEVARNQFLNYADSLCEYFNTLSTNLSNIQSSANSEVKSTVYKINTIAEQITSLNQQINTIEINGGVANDLRDARALLVDDLSAYVNTTVTEKSIGSGATEYVVYINNQVLVDDDTYNSLKCTARETSEKRNASDVEGIYDITWNNGLEFNVYSDSLSGGLKAMIDIRDGCNDSYEVVGLVDTSGDFLLDGAGEVVDVQDLTDIEYATYIGSGYEKSITIVTDSYRNSEYKGIPFYQSQLNEFVQTLGDAVNEIIGNGDLDGAAVEDFYVSQYGDSYLTASNVQVNLNMISDTSNLPYSLDSSKGEANTDMALELYALKDSITIKNGTFEDYLASLVSVIAIDSSRATTFSANYENIVATVENQRLSVSGVDEDEEGVDLVKYQNAYGLSAKVISVMQEIYDKLINETGL